MNITEQINAKVIIFYKQSRYMLLQRTIEPKTRLSAVGRGFNHSKQSCHFRRSPISQQFRGAVRNRLKFHPTSLINITFVAAVPLATFEIETPAIVEY